MRVTTTPGAVTEILISDHRTRNALSVSVLSELATAVSHFAGRDDTRVLVLAGSGGTFSSGGHLKEEVAVEDVVSATTRLYTAIQDSPKPVLARVEGTCLGLAVGVMAACDLAIAANDTRFALPEPRLGQAATLAAVTIVPRLRPADANRLLLTGTDFNGEMAREVGLVNASVPAVELVDEQQRWVKQLLCGGPAALAVCKRLAQRMPTLNRAEAMTWASELTLDLAQSPEAAEGRQAFTERRPPVWVAVDNEESR